MTIRTFLLKLKHKTKIRSRFLHILRVIKNKTHQIITLIKNYYVLVFGRFYKKTVLYVIGVQRSGTTALCYNLDIDSRVKQYNEFSELSENGDEKLRLHPHKQLKKQIQANTKPIILLKPLVETQNTLELLKLFPNSKAIWMFRHYRDVASSNLKNFGIDNGFKDLEPLINEDYNNWRAEGVPNDVRNTIMTLSSKNLNAHDAAALFWYMRSRFYFDLGLDKNNNVLLLKYDDFVEKPMQHFEKIYKHINYSLPQELADNTINSASVKKGFDIELNPEVEKVCDELYQKFVRHYHNSLGLEVSS